MKKIVLFSVVLSVMISALGFQVFAGNNVSVYVNEKPLVCEVEPFIKDGRTLVPMRQIFEALNAKVLWNGETKTITAARGDIEIILQIGSLTMYKNGSEIAMDVAPVISEDRTFVPIRAVSQSLESEVLWYDGNKTVYIDSPMAYSEATKGDEYKHVYADILYEKLNSDKYAHSLFSLVYIDDNDVPELVIGINDSHAAGAEVYTYVDGQVIKLSRYYKNDYSDGVSDVFGEFGEILYREKEGMFTSQYWGMGCEYISVYRLENGMLSDLVSLTGAEQIPDTSVEYRVNDNPVDRDTYMNTRAQYGFTGEYYSPDGYNSSKDNSVDLTENNIRAVFGI